MTEARSAKTHAFYQNLKTGEQPLKIAEVDLWRSVIYRAVIDASGTILDVSPYDRRKARAWILSDSTGWFDAVCLNAQLTASDVSKLRDVVRRSVDRSVLRQA